ncbi:MAG TPA: ABC transporter ATP-binding protein [Chloroflexota bacterium]|jgi:ABC-type Fe3+/spermidine/putrescine transport system ATPase subunit
MATQSVLRLNNVSKLYGSVRAADQVTLDVQRGEVFTLLGPSGCGKTTTLRLVAGLERLDGGEIYVGDRLVASAARRVFVPAHKRQMGMVFQSYAIWPHLTVFENVAYPLRARGTRGAALREKVLWALELVGLQGLEERPGPLLSGGQQQRVALARALVYEPDILLLDEPFSNLDAKLREHMRVEVRRLQRQLGITVLFVTHDQTEALSLSDRIAVMDGGHVVQVGGPQDLYDSPQADFVRDFLGKSVILKGRIAGVAGDGRVEVTVGNEAHPLVLHEPTIGPDAVSQPVFLAIRPEDLVPVAPDQAAAGNNRLDGRIDTLLFVGDRYECQVLLAGDQITAYLPRHTRYREGETISLHFPPEALSLWRP